MNRLVIPSLMLVFGASLRAQSVPAEGPRDAAQFAALFARSPFVMPSGGDQSPLSQRYSITGVASIDGEPRVFLLDQATKQRLTIYAGNPDGNVSLVSFKPNDNLSQVRATIRAGSETGEVSFSKNQLSPVLNATAAAPPPAATPPPAPALSAPPTTELVAAPQPQPSPPASTRRIIRRTTALPAPGSATQPAPTAQ